MKFFPRDISWLSFNSRVLQEAQNSNVPLIERLKFLGIFSSNQDEFFRVRYATQRRMMLYNESVSREKLLKESKVLLNQIKTIVEKQKIEYDQIYTQLLEELKENNIFLINETQLTATQMRRVRTYFRQTVLETLYPIILHKSNHFPYLKDRSIYLAIKMTKKNAVSKKYALVEIPNNLPRFFVFKEGANKSFVLFLDDVIRASMDILFQSLYYDEFEAYTLKLTRDAELDLLGDIDDDLMEVIRKSLKMRKTGEPVRLIYDKNIDPELFETITSKIAMKSSAMIAGQRYHNFKDFIRFPQIGNPKFQYPPIKTIPNHDFDKVKSILKSLKDHDFLLHHPYHSFDYLLKLLREAALDTKVTEIKITVYRLAAESNVVKALKNAIRNGKKVTVIMELQARFDEEANIFWANELKDGGATVIYGFPNKKVHTKLCIIYRKVKGDIIKIAHIGTGNYNEKTAELYSDFAIITAKPEITTEADHVFNIIEKQKLPTSSVFKHLLVAPFNLRNQIIKLINNEIKASREGKKAAIVIKVNSLSDPEIITALEKAVNSDVKVDLIVRGICCMVHNGQKNLNIISIVDKFLEHARIFWFKNSGNDLVLFGSADMMERNLDSRFEVITPILDKYNANILKAYLQMQLNDNVKARNIDKKQQNHFVKNDRPATRSQIEWQTYLTMNH